MATMKKMMLLFHSPKSAMMMMMMMMRWWWSAARTMNHDPRGCAVEGVRETKRRPETIMSKQKRFRADGDAATPSLVHAAA
jgi:hypothetical protein